MDPLPRVLLPAVVVALAGAACNPPGWDNGPIQTLTRSVELGDSTSVDVELHMGVGELNVHGGARQLMDGNFQFDVPSWEPSIAFHSGPNGVLRIEQPGHGVALGDTKNIWDVRLNDDVPIDLAVHLGTGKATMAIGSLDLSSVEVHQGVGELQLDLRGEPRRSYRVSVHGGVGAAYIQVPRSVAVKASASGGIGDIDVRGLQEQEGAWVNPGHEGDAVGIQLDVTGGVGKIVISADAGSC